MVGLEPIPAVTERESGYTLEISPVCQHIETDNHYGLTEPHAFLWIVGDAGKKLKRNHADTRRRHKLQFKSHKVKMMH